ncbi:TRAP transporter small permease subunit [Butyricicoccus sp.]|uniref:TRAP transporter small permease subunit n=1 Tax=Butyricicoccus sp. TaxID=2049021 RepID=UPI003F15918C
MKVLKRISSVIDLINDWVGRICSFAVIGVLAVIVIEVVMRRLLHSPQIWTQDSICMIFGCYIILVCAYGFQKKAFVAVDVLYARLKPLAQNILHLITYIIFLVPFAFVLVLESFTFFLKAFMTGEKSYSVWAPPTWPVKLCLFLGITLLALQGFSEIIKCVCNIADELQKKKQQEELEGGAEG